MASTLSQLAGGVGVDRVGDALMVCPAALVPGQDRAVRGKCDLKVIFSGVVGNIPDKLFLAHLISMP